MERISRPDLTTLRYEVTIDDPFAYHEPWSTNRTKRWNPNDEFIEYFCQDDNLEPAHLVGE